MEQDTYVTVKELLEAGAHWGHETRRWNPKMKRFIFEERNGLYIIDLAKTMQQIKQAVEVVKEVASKHQSVLFVGTKKQAKSVIRELAEQCGEFYVCERWLGGMLTNLSTIRQSVKKLDLIEKQISAGGEGVTKKEMILLTKKQIKLDRNLSGVRSMRRVPGLVVVVDPGREHLAVAEANKLGIPVLGLVDTNANPDPVQHIIACNDDSLKSIKLILSCLTKAISTVKSAKKIPVSKEEAVASEQIEVAFEAEPVASIKEEE